MKSSEIIQGQNYGYSGYQSRNRPMFSSFEHAEVLLANVRSFNELEAAGYAVARMPRYSSPTMRERGIAETNRVKALVESTQARGFDQQRSSIEQIGDGRFNAVQLVRLTSKSFLAEKDTQLVTKEGDPHILLVKAIHLIAPLDELIERAQKLADRQLAQAQGASLTADRVATELEEINQLLEARSLGAKPQAATGSRIKPTTGAVTLTHAEILQLLGG